MRLDQMDMWPQRSIWSTTSSEWNTGGGHVQGTLESDYTAASITHRALLCTWGSASPLTLTAGTWTRNMNNVIGRHITLRLHMGQLSCRAVFHKS